MMTCNNEFIELPVIETDLLTNVKAYLIVFSSHFDWSPTFNKGLSLQLYFFSFFFIEKLKFYPEKFEGLIR